MALAAGTRLGPYEITAQIGVGGMGEVHRATDTKLKRDVAVKVLPLTRGVATMECGRTGPAPRGRTVGYCAPWVYNGAIRGSPRRTIH